MRKFLLLTMMCVFGLFTVNAQVAPEDLLIVEVGADKNPDVGGNCYLPVYDYAYYTMSQQLYTAEDLNDNVGDIYSVAFKLGNAKNVQTRTYEVYFTSTELNAFDGENYVALTEDDKVFDGDVEISGEQDTWFTITFDRPFNYTGGNFVIAVYDKTGLRASYHSFYKYAATGKALCSDDSSPYDMLNLTTGTAKPYVNQIRFGIAADPEVRVSTETIALGNVKIGDYWDEDGAKSTDVTVQAISTTVTDISCDNNFFTLNYDLTAYPVILNVSYDKTAEVSGEQTATITIKADDVEDVTISVSATPYTPTTPDVYELAKEITFAGLTYTDTPEFANLNDDYNLPKEVNKGNTPDAIYSFELEEEVTVMVNVTGTNAVAAIYSEDFNGKGGPMANNANKGNAAASASSFFFDFNDGSLAAFDLIEKDVESSGYQNHQANWKIENAIGTDETAALVSYSFSYTPKINNANNIIVTKDYWNITSNSQLSFDAKCNSGYVDNVKVAVTEDGENFIHVATVTPGTLNYENVSVDFGAKFVELGLEFGNYQIALHHEEHDKMYVMVDNLSLSTGAVATRNSEPQINVAYPAGKYYLVAAAEDQFTVNVTLDVAPPAVPENVTATTIDETSIALTWSAVEDVDGYNIYQNEEFLTTVENDVTSYTVENLESNTTYCFIVTSVNHNIESLMTAIACAKTNDYEIGALDNVVVTAVDAYSVKLSWDAVENAQSYNVYYEGNLLANLTETVFVLEDLLPTTEYCFEVSAIRNEQETEKVKACGSTTAINFEDEKLATEFFYDFNNQSLSDFLLLDNDGDGNNWTVSTTGGYDDTPCVRSYSYWGSALTPDNYIYTKKPYRIEASSVVTLNAKCGFGMDTDLGEHYAVVVSENATDWDIVFEETIEHADWTNTTVSLEEYAGKAVLVGVRHYNCTGFYFLAVDNFALTVGEIEPEPEDPVTLEAPKNLRATIRQDVPGFNYKFEITMTWDAVEGAKGYDVYVNTADTTGYHMGYTNGTAYVAGTDKEATFEFYVVAFNDSITSEPSEVCTVTTVDDGVEELTSSLNIYPNPVNDKLFIETEVEIEKVAIYTLTGVMVGQQTTDNRQQTLSIDVANLNSGVYFVKVVTNEGEVVKRIVKK